MRPNLKRPHVLLVDDEALIRMTTADLLTDAGFDVEEVGSADEALKLVDEAHPVDVLVTDVEMPGRCNGCSLAWRIRALSPKVGVLVISGVARPAPDELPEGTYFLAKPVIPEQLLDAVRGALAARTNLREVSHAQPRRHRRAKAARND